MKDTIKYYIAGIIDGEGTITLSRIHSYDPFRSPVVSVSSTTLEILEFLKENLGGYISKQKVYKEHHKQSWSWKLTNSKAVSLCAELQDILLEPSKSRRAKMIAEIYPTITPRNGKYNTEMINLKEGFESDFFHPSNRATECRDSMSL